MQRLSRKEMIPCQAKKGSNHPSIKDGGFAFILCWLMLALNLPCLVHADLTINPYVGGGVNYDDNIDLSPTEADHDVVTSIRPGVDLNWTGRHGNLGISYNPSYNAYVNRPEYTFTSHTATLEGSLTIARGTSLTASNAYMHTEDPLTGDDTTVRRGRNPYFSNTATVGISSQFGAESQIDLTYTYYVLENDDITIEDSSYHQPELAMTYWFLPNRYAIEMEGQYTIGDFDTSEDFEDLGARIRLIKRFGRRFDVYIDYSHTYLDYMNDAEDYQVYSPIIGFAWDERADTRFEFSFGYFYRDNEFSGDDDGIVGNINVAYEWGPGGTITFNGSVGYDQAFFGAENLGFNPFYEIATEVTYPIAQRLTGTLSGSYRRSLYIDETPDREDSVWGGETGLAYQALPWLRLNLNYTYSQINSNVDLNDYTKNQVMLSVTLTPRQPIRF